MLLNLLSKIFSKKSMKIFIFSDDFLNVFNLDGKIPLNESLLEEIKVYSDEEILDEDFFDLEFFLKYREFFTYFVKNYSGEDRDVFLLFQKKIPLYIAAMTHDSNNYIYGAMKCYKEILKIDPFDSFSQYKLGLYYSFAEEYQKAVDMFERAILNYYNFYSVYFELSESYLKLNMKEKAINTLHRLLEFSPEDLVVRDALNEMNNSSNVGVVQKHYHSLVTEKKREKKEIEEDIISNWNDYENLIKLGNEAFENNYYSLARNSYEKALSLRDDKKIYFLVGVSALKNEKYRDALTIFLELLNNDNENGELYFYISMAYFYLGELKKSKRYLNVALDLKFISINSLELMFNIIKKENGETAAIEWTMEFGKKDEESYVPYYILALYYFEKDNFNKAVSNMEKALVRAHNEDFLYEEMVKILSAKGDYHKIPELLKNMSPLANIEPFHLWNIGVVCRNMNKKDEAIKIFEKFLSMDVPFEYKKRAETEIKNLKLT